LIDDKPGGGVPEPEPVPFEEVDNAPHPLSAIVKRAGKLRNRTSFVGPSVRIAPPNRFEAEKPDPRLTTQKMSRSR
jgi:hypothetical protein